MSTSDPNEAGSTPPPAGYPGAAVPPAPPAHPSAPSYPAPPAYGTPAAPQQGYPQAPTAYPAPGYPAPAGYGGYAPATKTNTMAIVSLILSIAGLVIVPFIGSLIGAILGHVSLNQLKTSGEQGRGLALAGVIVGWVGLALSILGVIAVIAWVGWVTSLSGTYST